MGDVILKIENVSKQYRLGQFGTGTLSHDLKRWWALARGKEDPYLEIGALNDRSVIGGEYAWALKEINFEVKQGDVLGIIGANGAGKSTLLKILSQVTPPSTGNVSIKGRIAALLEVGTGFHPELTGKENIFMNGAILGMTKSEINRKLEEIISFSGIAKYIDTPVKRYSSGMTVRLGFAIAAHLEPEILIVDEVLAVGDIEFQKKCLGKMKAVSTEGRTVIFVSHNMGAVKSLCKDGILLEHGHIIATGSSESVVDQYLRSGMEILGEKIFTGQLRQPKIFDYLQMHAVRITDGNHVIKTSFDVKEDIIIEIEYEVLIEKFSYSVHMYLKNESGEAIFSTIDHNHSPYNQSPYPEGRYVNRCLIPKNFLNDGSYSIDVQCEKFPKTTDHYCREDSVISFKVLDDMKATGVRGNWSYDWPTAMIRPEFKWVVEKIM